MRRLLHLLGVLPLALPALAGGDAAIPVARALFVEEELKAAKSQKFYLLLDPEQGTLDLRLIGVTVRRFPIEQAVIGVSRLKGGGAPQWPALGFTLASEVDEPDRPVITPPAAGQEQATVLPASDAGTAAAAEASPDGTAAAPASLADSLSSFREKTYAGIPPVYRLHFEPALDLVIRGEPPAQDLSSRIRRRWYHFEEGWSGFVHWIQGRPIATRVTVFMSPDDARRLYLALDPSIPLVVRPVGLGS